MENRVLIIDDDRVMQDLLANYFMGNGLKVRSHFSVLGAEQVLCEFDPHVILVDFFLPDGDGITLLKELRERFSPFPSVIVFTGQGNLAPNFAYIADADAIFYKPCDPKDLLAAVQHFATKSQIDRDLSDRLRITEKSLTEASSMSLLGELSAGIMHDIRNPLAIVASQLELLEDAVKNNATPEAVLVRIQKIAQAIDRVINIATSFRSATAKSASVGAEEVSLEHILNEVSQMLSAKLRTANIDFKMLSRGNPVLKGNSTKIFQVLLNMINNSIEAIVNLTEKWIRVEIFEDPQDPRVLVLKITDSGPRLSEEMIQKIMQPFFTTKPKGNGIGLNLCKKIITEHEGTLNINREDPNMCFEIFLPRA